MITPVSGISSEKAATPITGTRIRSISSEPYAVEEMQSEASTPSAIGLDSFSSRSCSVISGGPSRRRLTRYVESVTRRDGVLGRCHGPRNTGDRPPCPADAAAGTVIAYRDRRFSRRRSRCRCR